MIQKKKKSMTNSDILPIKFQVTMRLPRRKETVLHLSLYHFPQSSLFRITANDNELFHFVVLILVNEKDCCL